MKKNEKEVMDIVFLLDRSGSMSGMESDTIGGYNGYLKNMKKSNAYVTTVLFDDKYEMITKRKDINETAYLTEKEYYVRGATALLDAIGNTINFMDKEKADKVLFIITTDGYENASCQFNKEQIKEMIKGHSKWEFMYIGADIDSYSEGQSLGIDKSNIANYIKDQKGIIKMYDAMCLASSSFYENDCLNSSWKQELDKYIEQEENK